MKEFIFWQDSLSIHQSAFIRSLAATSGTGVTLVAWDEIDPNRKGTGWYRPDFGAARIIIKPTPKARSGLLASNPSSSVHVFSGTRAHPMIWDAFCHSRSVNAYTGIYSEAQNGSGLKGFLRLLRGKYDSLRFRERVNFILATGSLGVEWFGRTGYLPGRIFPFGYFVETPPIHDNRAPRKPLSNEGFDLIFVGQLIRRKGWDILLHALNGLESSAWRLHIVGDGKEKAEFVRLCGKLGLTSSVRFYGNLENSETMNLISTSDLLVLPSRWDGWGAVVSEALMLGTPVVCSDKCGAADLLDGHERGEVFASESIVGLRAALLRRVSQGKKDAVASERIIEWSKCISGQSAADYFIEIIGASTTGGGKPAPPWSERSSLYTTKESE